MLARVTAAAHDERQSETPVNRVLTSEQCDITGPSAPKEALARLS